MKTAAKILVVEDEGIVAFNLQQRLQQLGYKVIGPAESDADSLALVASEQPDLVLMDIHIKGKLDGIDLAGLLGSQFQLPVVYLTAYSEDATLERARLTRPYGYLIKPFSERELHATVQMALERHEVQQALRASQTLLEQALQAAQMGVVHIRPATDTIRLAGVPARLAGLTDDQDHSLSEFAQRIDPDERESFLEACHTGQLRRRTLRLPADNGRSHWLQIDATADGSGLLQGVVQNVSDREDARAALQNSYRHLEDRVRHRTEELRRHIHEVESFSHAAAHDLRSPIRAIAGFGQILQEDHGDALGESGRSLINRITLSAKRMAELIDALLGLSRLSQTPLHPEALNLADIARDLQQSLVEAEPNRDVRFNIVDQAPGYGDRALLRSLLQNLMQNAWKFSRDRHPAFIDFAVDQVDGRTVYRVQDNGSGFDGAQKDKIFNAFFRLHDERHFGGFGLGLSIAARIVARHGGRIWAESEVDRGATICFTLGE